jgi:DnaK suppressor protein
MPVGARRAQPGSDKPASDAYVRRMANNRSPDLKDVRARLDARRQELHELTASHRDEARPVELDLARIGRLSRMDALQAQEMAAATERRRQLELDRIDAALERLASGEYGYCARCGDDIGLQRLGFDPTTPLCITCARAGER